MRIACKDLLDDSINQIIGNYTQINSKYVKDIINILKTIYQNNFCNPTNFYFSKHLINLEYANRTLVISYEKELKYILLENQETIDSGVLINIYDDIIIFTEWLLKGILVEFKNIELVYG